MAKGKPRNPDSPWGRRGLTRAEFRRRFKPGSPERKEEYASRIHHYERQGLTRKEARGHKEHVIGPKPERGKPEPTQVQKLRGQGVRLVQYRTDHSVIQALKAAYKRTNTMKRWGPWMIARFSGPGDPAGRGKKYRKGFQEAEPPDIDDWVQAEMGYEPYAIPIPEDVPDDEKSYFSISRRRDEVAAALAMLTFERFVHDSRDGIDPNGDMDDVFLWVTDVHFVNSPHKERKDK